MTKNITLDEMVGALIAAYGTSLKAVVLYGSAVRAEQRTGRSDYNLLIVVDALDHSRTERISPAVVRWVSAGNPPPLTFTSGEWRSSGDVFPMEYADVLEAHRVLHGTLDMSGVEVKLDHLRLQLEQEAMGKLLWLRQGAAIAGADHRARTELLVAAFSKLLVVLRGLLRFHGERPPHDKSALVARAAELANFDAQPLLRVHESIAGKAPIAAGAGSEGGEGESGALVARVLTALEALVSHVNSFQPASRVYVATTEEDQ